MLSLGERLSLWCFCALFLLNYTAPFSAEESVCAGSFASLNAILDTDYKFELYELCELPCEVPEQFRSIVVQPNKTIY